MVITEKSYPPLISSIPWRSDRTHGRAFTDTQSLIATEPIISKGLEMRAVRCSRLSPPPQLRQIKPEKKVLQVSGASAQIGNINVPSIDKAQFLRQYRTTEMTGGLRGSKPAPIGKGRD
jgi:hypothetical protein